MVLDVFKIMFESDTSTLEKGTKKSEQEANKLNKKLEQTDKTASKVGDNLKGLLATGLGALTAIASFGGIVAGVMDVANYSDELAKNSALLGENINELAAYQDIATKAGGSSDGLTATFKNLNGQINEFATLGTTQTLPYFQKLGISLLDASGKARKVSDILPELADSFSKMSKTESAGLGQKLGLDQGTIALLQSGRRELEINLRKQKELFSITKEQAKVSEDFNDTIHDTKTVFRGLFLTIGGAILPVLQFLLEKFQKIIVFLRNNSDFATGIFIALGAAITAFVVPALYGMAVAANAFFTPFYLIGAVVAGVITLFALLYDDIMTFLNGGESAFGNLLNYMSDEIQSVKDAFKSFGDFVLDIVGLIGDAFAGMAKGIGTVFKGIIHVLEPIFYVIMQFVKEIIKGISGAVDVVKSVGNFFGIGVEDNTKSKKLDSIGAANANPVNTYNAAASNSNKSNSVKIDKVEVNTQATDAEGISRSINQSLSNEITNANNNFDDGVLA